MRYDGGMKWGVRQPSGLLCLVVVVVVALAGCGEGQPLATSASGSQEVPDATSNPVVSRTLQADAAMTAAWLMTLTPVMTPTNEPFPTAEPANLAGTPPVDRTGACPVPEGFVLHNRAGFCLGAPSSWTVLNVDGGMAAFLKTTPGQAISLQPEWAESSTVCHLLIYISAEESAIGHLEPRYTEFASRSDVQELSPIRMQSLGEIGMLGFLWVATSGESGGAYAAMLGPNRLLHISYSGSDCSLDRLLPVLETLRIN